MDLSTVAVILSLIERGAATMKALQGVGEVIKNKVENGEEITIDDLKQYELADDAARDALVAAIEAEENG